jgi:hypothetical protein
MVLVHIGVVLYGVYCFMVFSLPYLILPTEPIVLDDFKSAHFQKHELGVRAFPTRG